MAVRTRLGLLLGLALAAALPAQAAGTATPQEVVEKVRAAAALLASEGEAGLAQFQGPGSAWVWKDSYVYVSSCETGRLLAHPTQPARQGQPIADGPTYGGVTAAEREKGQCAAAARPGGGWYAYPFPKPGSDAPSRKVSYLVTVPGQAMIVGAGVYDETTSEAELEAVSAAAK
ncbi:MAG: cache domain-containing protein [Geminicoccaceae bacterium]